MEQQEALAGVGNGTVAPVEAGDPLDRRREEPIILRHDLGGGVQPVGEEREVHGAVRIGEVVDFQAIDVLADLALRGQERRHHDERSQARRDAVAQLEARQRPRAEQVRDRAIDERDREVGGRDQREEAEQGEGQRVHAPGMGQEEREGEEERGDDADGAEVARRRPRHVGAEDLLLQRDPVADCLLEERQPVRDEVVRGILGAASGGRTGLVRRRRGALRVGDRLPGDVELGLPGASRQLLDRVTVAIARREVQGAEVAGRSQRLIDQADTLEELGPIERRHRPHARDHVADRHVRRGLTLVLDSHQLVGRRAQGRELSVEPGERGR